MTPIIVATTALVLIYLGTRFGLAYFRLSGTRVITCPADRSPAAVEVNARKAAAGALFGRPRFRLTGCSHWPERLGCGQECLSEVEASPVDCLVRTHLTHWYVGKTCALCARPFGEINWYERRPALLSAEKSLLLWDDVDVTHLGDMLRTSRPVCFDCHLAETFRLTRPELVLDNPYATLPPGRS
jgi:hypothetical protein